MQLTSNVVFTAAVLKRDGHATALPLGNGVQAVIELGATQSP